MSARATKDISEMTIATIISTVLARRESTGFSDQDFFRLFFNIQKDNPALEDYYQVIQVGERYQSKPISSILSNFVLWKAIKADPPNPVEQKYELRQTAKADLVELRKPLLSDPEMLRLFDDLAKQL